RQGKIVQDIFTVAKTTALFGLIVVGFLFDRNAAAISQNFSHLWDGQWLHMSGGIIQSVEPLAGLMLVAAIGVSMVGSLFSSDAWNNITFTASEVISPKRNIPLSLALGTGTVTLLYILANVAYLLALPLTGNPGGQNVLEHGIQFAANDRVATAAISTLAGAPAVIIMAVFIMVSTFGCANGLILAGARVYYAMAKDGLFFKSAGTLNTKSVPAMALVAQTVWACALCLSGTYNELLDYVIFAVLIFYILTIGGIFILRKKRPNAERPYKAFGYPVIPALYIVLAIAICVDLLIFKPNYTWPGLVIVLLGVPVYFVWKAKTKLIPPAPFS
ncbi:MAG TPA: amino acid permease, partial [Bacteroidota bacterium]|nr:amino acid permease [Bacteroidota bacterium]